jgi:hypothetical protein
MSQTISDTLESLLKQATLIKPLRLELLLIAKCLLQAPTSQITKKEIQKWLVEKYLYY